MEHNDLIRKSKNGKVVECVRCGKSAYRSKSQLNRNAFYCSVACFRDDKNNSRTCGWCEQTFHPHNPSTPNTGLFCSQTCWRAKINVDNPRTKEVGCQQCGTDFTIYISRLKKGGGKYCSRQCAGEARVENAGRSRGVGWKQTRKLTRERDVVCVRCGGHDRDRELAVDHIIPWSVVKGSDNANHQDNLACLCAPCHGVKTVVVERALKVGNTQPLLDFYTNERLVKATTLLSPAEASALGLTKHSWE
jgi:Zn ribbon nucleic-acid-binding protein